ncbi:hypothetical protein BO86DRAFT_397116 [Aspergillus japonicus CBS 114.51]|uniref:Uncharacterized protein n=1 Tax=Aspergillus japonicus CBS 114.51 TaxID=1448312 RepID=A0A8T8X8C4_ASPJA|nr:hypothetical protein BO86DRAFT_397116 [Aspergillus japonicus CBS 114.51]RAH84250.1 hypothetical protein BO86DRAFT_397116 [Aspergillus japonicus CBS 114.51]
MACLFQWKPAIDLLIFLTQCRIRQGWSIRCGASRAFLYVEIAYSSMDARVLTDPGIFLTFKFTLRTNSDPREVRDIASDGKFNGQNAEPNSFPLARVPLSAGTQFELALFKPRPDVWDKHGAIASNTLTGGVTLRSVIAFLNSSKSVLVDICAVAIKEEKCVEEILGPRYMSLTVEQIMNQALSFSDELHTGDLYRQALLACQCPAGLRKLRLALSDLCDSIDKEITMLATQEQKADEET